VYLMRFRRSKKRKNETLDSRLRLEKSKPNLVKIYKDRFRERVFFGERKENDRRRSGKRREMVSGRDRWPSTKRFLHASRSGKTLTCHLHVCLSRKLEIN